MRESFRKIDGHIFKKRSENGKESNKTINELDLSQYQKIQVLEWFAEKIWKILEEGSGEPDYYGKSYDPLYIDGLTAHSYVFDFEDGGRHHQFRDFEHLEEMLVQEGIYKIRSLITEALIENE